MLRLFKRLLVALALVVFAGCSGGGCTSGCACGGVEPLAEGFDPASRIENAAAVRITDSGFGFLEQNVGTLASTLLGSGTNGGVLTFEIPSTSGSTLGISYNLCPAGPNPNGNPPSCVAEIDLGNAQLQIDPGNPHNIQIHGPLPIRVQRLPINITYLFIPDSANMVLSGNGCSSPASFADIDLVADISIEVDTDVNHSRYGYSRVRIGAVDIPNQSQVSGAINFCGGGFSNFILGALKGLIVPMLMDQLVGTLGAQLESALCQQANPALNPPCPTGTSDVDGVCRYGNDPSAECASIILGLDGHIDAGALMASFSPGTRGAFDFLLAAGGHSLRDDGSGLHWGDLNATPSGAPGATLGMYGGAEPRPTSKCVPLSTAPLPTGIPIPDELLANGIAGWPAGTPGPHVGIALSERFTNYALAQVYNSGALCLGIGGDLVAQLTSNLVAIGIGAPSMTEVGWQKTAQQLAIAIRPQTPPVITFGNGTDLATDPLLRVTAQQWAFDFYMWSLDRFVRVFTATFDLDIPLNLEVTPDGLQPVLENIGVTNGVVTNSTLIREDPQKIATSLSDLLGSLVGQFVGGSLPVVDLNSSLASTGLELVIPDTVDGQGSPGLRKLSKGSDNYLGIFAALALAPAAQASVDTTMSYVSFDPGNLGWDGSERVLPEAVFDLGVDAMGGSARVEWQYRVDTQPWHPFRASRTLVIRDPWLATEGKHIVSVRARVGGDYRSIDRTPATFELDVDSSPPVVHIAHDDGRVTVTADDAVSGDATQVRVRLGQTAANGVVAWHAWSEWARADDFEAFAPGDNDVVEVEAQDETGHIATTSQALIRGRGPSDAGGCQCAIDRPASGGGFGAGWLALAGAAVALGRRFGRPRSPVRSKRARRPWLKAAAGLLVVLLPSLFVGCSCGEEEVTETGCRATGTCLALNPGLIGAYTSAVTDGGGNIWVAGYLEADWQSGFSWGDLVVGSYDGTNVAWSIVDGVPAEPPVNPNIYDPQGFRGGQTEAGDDVGLWTSIALDPTGQPAVAYYDATNHALRYASSAGGVWAVGVVVQGAAADYGRYAKLLFQNGLPLIAYQFTESGADGTVASGVRLATGSAAAADQAQWTFEDVALEPATPCRARFCSTGTACVASTGTCIDKRPDCSPGCASGEQCVDVGGAPQCEAVFSVAQLDSYPDASGLYVSMAARPGGGVGIAFYDRVHGNVVAASKNGADWTTVIADGESGGTNIGDKGIGLSLAIDLDGHYHLAYVDGLSEAVDYVRVTDGATPGTVEVVDTGLGNDGQHLVGDDSNIVVTQGGEIHITYQDATTGVLRYAVGTPANGAHAWSVNDITQEGFAGAFSRQLDTANGPRIVNWWRVATPAAKGEVRVVAP